MANDEKKTISELKDEKIEAQRLLIEQLEIRGKLDAERISRLESVIRNMQSPESSQN